MYIKIENILVMLERGCRYRLQAGTRIYEGEALGVKGQELTLANGLEYGVDPPDLFFKSEQTARTPFRTRRVDIRSIDHVVAVGGDST